LDNDDDNINEFEELTEELNADTELLTIPIEPLADELYTVIVPLIDELTANTTSNDCDTDELIIKSISTVPPGKVPPVNVADCVTATGT
jgi:hypothetical protein